MVNGNKIRAKVRDDDERWTVSAWENNSG